MDDKHKQPPPPARPSPGQPEYQTVDINTWTRIFRVETYVRSRDSALLASARPDRNYWLISYPYYVKDTSAGEKTGFHHLDLNARRCVETGKGANIVQGALALDDEDDDNATVLVKGFHHHMERWYNKIQSRNQQIPNGETTDLKTLYTASDREEFGYYTPVPCKRGEVRINLPTIPHGSTAKATKTRRAIFPWWTGIKSDHFHLDNNKSESYDELALCHLHRVRPLQTLLPREYLDAQATDQVQFYESYRL
jgi:ectoine hydroxylase-related dioxygenase (phytanoyl-CoA dioxygenase family)